VAREQGVPGSASRKNFSSLLAGRLLLPPVGVRSRPMLFDQDEHKRTMKVVAIVLAVVFLIGMFALGGVLLFT
jgi:hypothetical protein